MKLRVPVTDYDHGDMAIERKIVEDAKRRNRLGRMPGDYATFNFHQLRYGTNISTEALQTRRERRPAFGPLMETPPLTERPACCS
jgi:hypothetical protein